jgi:hypothetical protein
MDLKEEKNALHLAFQRGDISLADYWRQSEALEVRAPGYLALITSIKQETVTLLLAFQHDTISRKDLVRRLEALELRAPGTLACHFTKAACWAQHGQDTSLVSELKGIIANRRFQTRH